MAVKKVDRHLLWAIKAQAFKFKNDTSHDTTGKSIEARLFDYSDAKTAEDQGVKINGSESGDVAGNEIPLTFDLEGYSGWYELRIMANWGQADAVGMLPNPETADKILVFIRDSFATIA